MSQQVDEEPDDDDRDWAASDFGEQDWVDDDVVAARAPVVADGRQVSGAGTEDDAGWVVDLLETVGGA